MNSGNVRKTFDGFVVNKRYDGTNAMFFDDDGYDANSMRLEIGAAPRAISIIGHCVNHFSTITTSY